MVTVKQHALVVMVVVLVGDLLLPVGVTFPQLLVHHLLDLWNTTPSGLEHQSAPWWGAAA